MNLEKVDKNVDNVDEATINLVLQYLNDIEEIWQTYSHSDNRKCACSLYGYIVDVIFNKFRGTTIERCRSCYKWKKINEGEYEPEYNEDWYCFDCWDKADAYYSIKEESEFSDETNNNG
ncbi:MAG: hypothetical protein KatS3mg096_722 [Candidatus Parcubacteria bacterium]|nr:MAG: hypothetical protein KatS3mg096_722 [Candidatus Parcubacteria bacterium]